MTVHSMIKSVGVSVAMFLGAVSFSSLGVEDARSGELADAAKKLPAVRALTDGKAQPIQRIRARLAKRGPVRAKLQQFVGRSPATTQTPPQDAKPDPYAWRSLFDGKTLDGWKITDFPSHGEVRVEDGCIVLPCGLDLTGVTSTLEDLPTDNFEIELKGMRTDGSDFFATTTFPVGDGFCSFVTGGWGGTITGLSCVDYYDASDNLTTKFRNFEDNTWYTVRIRVSTARVEVWIDDEQCVNQVRKDHKFNLRFEVDFNKPLGISSWCTGGKVRDIRIRLLTTEEIEAAANQKDEQW